MRLMLLLLGRLAAYVVGGQGVIQQSAARRWRRWAIRNRGTRTAS